MTAVGALVFLSGFAGLVYEVVWARQLALALGGAAVAQTEVLALFLGGLAAGNALFGPKADRHPNPLRLYALLELGVALLGAASPLALRLCERAPGPWAHLGAAAVLLPPAVLMGGTLPALTRWRVRVLEDLRPGLGLLYGLNSAGGAAGALAAGFLLVPRLGLDGPLLLAAVLNAALAGWAWRLGTRPARPVSSEGKEASGPGVESRALVLAAAFLAGLATLAYEVVWIRLLTLSLGASTYAFSLMLAAFISGISLGSLWAARRRAGARDPRLGFARMQAGVVAAAAASAFLYERLPYLSLMAASRLPRVEEAFPWLSALQFGLCFLALLPPTFFIGAQLPWAVRAATRSAGAVGSGVGSVFSWNTFGNVLGAAAAGLWLLPALGLHGLLRAAMAANALAAVAVSGRAKARWAWSSAAAAAAAALLHAAAAGPFDRLTLTGGAYRLRAPRDLSFAEFREAHSRDRLLFYRDDREGTVTVTEDPAGVRYLKVNGKSDASTSADMATQALLAHLPLVLKPAARRVLVVGLGSGVTAGAALAHPIERLDVAEISPAVAEAEPLFRPSNGAPTLDPRLRLRLEDAKRLIRKPGVYDIVVSEPSNPWIAGIGDLFSADFYARTRERLAPGGVMVQWFHLYEMSDETLRLVLRTFAAAFPHASAWDMGSNDILLIGSEAPLRPDFAAAEAAFDRGPVRSGLRAVGVESLAVLLSLQALPDAALRAAAGEGPVNRYRFPRLEHEAPRALFLDRQSRLLERFDVRGGPAAEELLLARYLEARRKGLSPEERSRISRFRSRFASR